MAAVVRAGAMLSTGRHTFDVRVLSNVQLAIGRSGRVRCSLERVNHKLEAFEFENGVHVVFMEQSHGRQCLVEPPHSRHVGNEYNGAWLGQK